MSYKLIKGVIYLYNSSWNKMIKQKLLQKISRPKSIKFFIFTYINCLQLYFSIKIQPSYLNTIPHLIINKLNLVIIKKKQSYFAKN